MWRGGGPTVARAAVGAMTELPVYDEVKAGAIAAGIVQPGIQSHLFSALCAGFFSTFWMNPFVSKGDNRFDLCLFFWTSSLLFLLRFVMLPLHIDSSPCGWLSFFVYVRVTTSLLISTDSRTN